MAEFIKHMPCEVCGSSDANALYSDESTFCFACENVGQGTSDPTEGFNEVSEVKVPTIIKGFRDRQITKVVAEHYGVTVNEDQTKHYYPYTKDGMVVGHKVRTVATKQFTATGKLKQTDLFGQSLFQSGGKKVVITEGELDAMAVAQAYQTKYNRIFPVVSVPSGAQSAAKAILNNREWVRSFDEVILLMDSDEPGRKAAEECAKVVGPDKARIATLQQKDACDCLVQAGASALDAAIWNASPWMPAGIMNGADAWQEYMEEKDAVYMEWPSFVPKLNEKIHGVRAGSITMLTSGTGCGKSTFVKEFVYNVLKNTDDHIGLVSLEESIPEQVRGFISLELNKRVGLPGVETTEKEERKAFENIFGGRRVHMLDHQGSCEDSSLLDKLEFMALSGCKYIVLDHITIAVSEVADGNTNNAIDALMSSLLKLTKRHDCHITCISHLRKVGQGDSSFEDGGDISLDDLRGSGSLKQISAQVIALSRNLSADSDAERHTVKVKVLKDRWTGATGWAGCYKFNQTTGRLEIAATTDEHGFSKETA